MASSQKRLGEFLNEQQEPFMLELYLLERGYLNEDSLKKRKKKVLIPFSNFLASIVNKLAFHSQGNSISTSRDNGQRKKHASCNVQISSASYNSTMFNSCSNVDEEGTSISSHKDHHLCSSHIHQTCKECNMRWERQRCIEGKIPLESDSNVNEEVREMQQRTNTPKKIREDSLLSGAIFNLLGVSSKKEDCTNQSQEYISEPRVSQVLKSKRVLSHKIKKLLFDCVEDITITLPTKEVRKHVRRQSMGPIEFEKLTCQGTREWRQYYSEDGLMSLFTIDYLDSIMEWSKFEQQVKDISFEISDAILDILNNEIVLEIIATLPP
ncbi:hypothetical protein RYX36_022645 [Vicia faba]